MPPKGVKKQVKALQRSLRVLREEDQEMFMEICEDYAVTFASLFLEPNHAIQQRAAAELHEDVDSQISELLQ
jgi:hypothetical protein